MWSIVQAIVNHSGQKDYQNYWAYFPLNPQSVYGSSGVSPEKSSSAWKGAVAPGVYGVQFVADGTKIFADPNKGWIAYANLSDTLICARTFSIFEGEQYPDNGARVTVYVSSSSAPTYMEVEVKAPVVALSANGGKYSFTEDWWAAKMEGPVLDVNPCGARGAKLKYNTASQLLSARYGVFHEGTVKVAYSTNIDQYLLSNQLFAVSPLEQFQLLETVTLPDSANTIFVKLFNLKGDLIGILDSISRSQLLTVDEPKSPARVSDFQLESNYPNPFNGGTVLTFSCAKSIYGSLKIYDLLGKEIAILAASQFSAGTHRYEWNPGNLATGIYIARLEIGNVRQMQKMIYLR